MATQKAGGKLINFVLHDPLGEELMEGILGGSMAGLAQLGQDQPLEQTALNTAAAIAGGIGMGMIGRRAGAAIGKKLHAAPLKQQDSMLANVGRMVGSETTAGGLRDQGAMMKAAVQEGLTKQASSDLIKEAVADPELFARRYGVTPEVFQKMAPNVGMGQQAAAVAEALRSMPSSTRQEMLGRMKSQLPDYEAVEKLINTRAAAGIDENIEMLAKALDEGGLSAEDLEAAKSILNGKRPGDAVRSLLDPVQPITGEHVGRAAGRFLGDEIGILGGLAGGAFLGQSLGLESPKDRQIRELQAQLAGG